MKSTRLILVLLLSAVMVEHIYGKSYEDEADYFDLDDYEENSDDYLDFEAEDIEEYKGKRRNASVKEAVPVKEVVPVKKISIFDRMNNMRTCDLQCPCKSESCWAESSKRKKCIDNCLASLSKSDEDIEEEAAPSATVSNKKVSNKVAAASATNVAKNAPVAFYSLSTVAKKMKCPKDMKCKKYGIPDECDLTCEGKINEKNGQILVEKNCADCIIKSRCDLYCVQKNDKSRCDKCETNLYI